MLVVDKMGGPGMGDTSRSAAAFRAIFTSRVNRLLAGSTISFYEDLQSRGVDLGMRFVGYLFLVTKSSMSRVMRAVGELGGLAEVLDPSAARGLGLRTRVSGLEEAELMGLEDVEKLVLVRRAGIIDPEAIVRFYESEFLRMGGEVAYGVEVTRIVFKPRKPLGVPGEPLPWQDEVVVGVETNKGPVGSRNVVLSTGAWTQGVLDEAGLPVPIKPVKRQVFVVKASTDELRSLLYNGSLTGEGVMPMLILPKNVYVRPEPDANCFYIGVSDRRPYTLEEDPRPEPDLWKLGILPVLECYVPAFAGRAPDSSWAGHYDENIIDYQPVVDKLAEGLYVAAGTSGSGIMKADAVGRIAASLALGYERATLFTGETVGTDLLASRRGFEVEELVI